MGSSDLSSPQGLGGAVTSPVWPSGPLSASNWQGHKEGFVDPSARVGTWVDRSLSSPRPQLRLSLAWTKMLLNSSSQGAEGGCGGVGPLWLLTKE